MLGHGLDFKAKIFGVCVRLDLKAHGLGLGLGLELET